MKLFYASELFPFLRKVRLIFQWQIPIQIEVSISTSLSVEFPKRQPEGKIHNQHSIGSNDSEEWHPQAEAANDPPPMVLWCHSRASISGTTESFTTAPAGVSMTGRISGLRSLPPIVMKCRVSR